MVVTRGRFQGIDRGLLRCGEQVQIEIIFAGHLIVEHAFEHQGAFFAAHRVKVKPLLQVWRQLLEIRLASVNAGGDRIGQLRQASAVDVHGLLARRIKQGHAVFGEGIRRILRHRLLVEHLRAFLAADLRQAEFWQRQRFADPQFRDIPRPCGAIGDRQRLVVLACHPRRIGVDLIDRKKFTRASRITKKWQNRSHCRLRGLAGRSRNEKSILAGVIELHRQRRQILPRLRRRRCTLRQHVAGRIDDADDRSGAGAADAGAADGHSHHQPPGIGDGDRGPAGGRTQQLGIAVWPAVNPSEALAIFKGKARVGGIRAETRVAGKIHRAEDFNVLGRARRAGARHRQRQQRQRIGFHQQSPRRRGVVEAVGRIAAHHLISVHRGPLVRRVGVGHQNIGFRRVTRAGLEVQIIAQGISAARAAVYHERVFFVGIVSRLREVVLHVDRASTLLAGQVAGADPLGDHDLRRCLRITHCVATDLAGQIQILEIRARCRCFFEPAHREYVVSRQGIDGDDRSRVGGGDADDTRVQIACGVIASPCGNVASDLVITRCCEAGADRRRAIDRRATILFHRVIQGVRGIRQGSGEHIAGVIGDADDGRGAADSRTRDDHPHLQPRRAVHCHRGHPVGSDAGRDQREIAGLGLGVKVHIPTHAGIAEFEQ